MASQGFERVVDITGRSVMCEKREEWYVAYFDILGATRKMKSPSGYHELVKAVKDCWGNAEMFGGGISLGDLKIEVRYVGAPGWKVEKRIFSDNIVCGVKCIDDRHGVTLPYFLSLVSMFQKFMFEWDGILLRGAVCRGEITFDDDFVIGPALIRAHEMENHDAVHPRIILDEPIVDEMKDIFMKKAASEEEYMSRDKDGWYFLDYLREVKTDATGEGVSTETYVDKAVKFSGADMNDERVADKYRWLREKLS